MSLPKSVYKRLPKRMPHSLGFSEHCLKFNGVDQYVEVADDPVFHFQDELTVSAWVKLKTDLNVGAVDKDNNWMIHCDSYNIRYIFRDNAGNSYAWGPAFDASDEQWHHAVIEYSESGSFAKLFVDGEFIGSDATAGNPLADESGNPLTIGKRAWGDEWFEGSIDEVRVYHGILSPEEVRRITLGYHRAQPGYLVGRWRLERGFGTTAADLSGNGNDGTLKPATGPPEWTDVKKWELRSEVGL